MKSEAKIEKDLLFKIILSNTWVKEVKVNVFLKNS